MPITAASHLDGQTTQPLADVSLGSLFPQNSAQPGNWTFGKLEMFLNGKMNISDLFDSPSLVPPEVDAGQDVEEEPIPSHLTSDYLEIGFLAAIFAVGMLVNIYVFFNLYRQYAVLKAQKKNEVKASVTLFKLHLTASNLLVLALYCPSKLAWLVYYSWPWGAATCKMVHFVWLFVFCLSSNMVASIALDRALHVFALCRLSQGVVGASPPGAHASSTVRRLLAASWLAAAVCAAPQLRVFDVIVWQEWPQCATVWRIADAWRLVGLPYDNDVGVSEHAYRIFHLLTVFWAPFVVIGASYAYIVVKLLAYSCSPYSALAATATTPQPPRRRTSAMEMSHVVTRNPRDGAAQEKDNAGARTAMTGDAGLLAPGDTAGECPSDVGALVSTAASPAMAPRHEENGGGGAIRGVPAWRAQMRTKMFRTAASIVVCYCLCWLPYSAISVAAFVDEKLAYFLSETVDWLKCLILVNVVLNPFLYGFRST